MSTATVPPVRAVPGANFASKSARKRYRKDLINGRLNNALADARVNLENRAAFYRRLRVMKLRRIAIAKKMVSLSVTVDMCQQALRRVEDRCGLAGKTVAEKKALADLDAAMDLARAARGAVQAAADEWQVFAKQKIYYSEVAG